MIDREAIINIFDKIAVLFNFTAEEVSKAHKSNTLRLKRLLSSALKQLSENDLRTFTQDEVDFMVNELGLETKQSILNDNTESTLEDMIAEFILLQNASLFTLETILRAISDKVGEDESVKREIQTLVDILSNNRVKVLYTKDNHAYTLNLDQTV